MVRERHHGADRWASLRRGAGGAVPGRADVTEARHFQAIWLLAQGRTVLEVAEVLAFVPRWVTQLAARYNASGPEALGDRRRRNGRTASLLTEAVLAALAGRVRTPPEDGG